MKASYVMGLDVGPPGEPTGFAILERPAMDQRPREYVYRLRHVERVAPGTAFTAIIQLVAERKNTAQIGSPPLVMDLTAVGQRFLEQCWKSGLGLNPQAIVLGSGVTVQKLDNWITQVPKRDLVTSLQLAFQGRRLKIAPDLPQADLLTAELSGFRLRAVTLSDAATLEWRTGAHDDLVFAVALAVWFADKHPPLWPDSIGVGRRESVWDGVFGPLNPSFRPVRQPTGYRRR